MKGMVQLVHKDGIKAMCRFQPLQMLAVDYANCMFALELRRYEVVIVLNVTQMTYLKLTITLNIIINFHSNNRFFYYLGH